MKNKLLKNLSDLFKSGCVIFTFVVFAFYILADIMTSAVMALTLKNLFLLFLFSIWFAGSNRFLKNNKFNFIVKLVLHFISTLAGFFVIFVYLPGNLANKSRAFVLTLTFAGVYILIAAVILIFKNALNKKKNEKEEYESVYDNSKEDKE